MGAGLIAWGGVTGFYGAFGGPLLESSFWFYAVNAALAALGMLAVFQIACRLRRTARNRRLLAGILFALPGLIGGTVVYLNLEELFPQLEAVSHGRYAAFLLVGYAAILGLSLERSRAKPRVHLSPEPEWNPIRRDPDVQG